MSKITRYYNNKRTNESKSVWLNKDGEDILNKDKLIEYFLFVII